MDKNTRVGAEETGGEVIGRNAVRELLRSGRSVDKLLIQSGRREGAVNALIAEARNRGIPVIEVGHEKLDSISDFAPHQGIIAMAAGKDYCEPEDILNIAGERGEKPLIVVGDGIEDPYNLGALIRNAECAGAHGLIIPKRRAAGLTPHAVRASAGAAEHLAVSKVVNITRTVEELKERGVWIFGADMTGRSYYECDFNIPAAVIFGGEDKGISSLVRSKCDFLVSIPMYGKVNSLNVSASAAVILSETARQRAAAAQSAL